MNIIFITVSYNNFTSTKEYVESFLSLNNSSSATLVVVDNSTHPDKDLEVFVQDLPDFIVYVRQGENKGYMSACNYGYDFVRDRLDSDSVIIYSNNDLVFNTKDMLQKITSHFDEDSSIGVLSPKVIDAHSSKNLNPFLINRPTYSTLIKLRLLYSNYLLCKIFYYLRKPSDKAKVSLVAKDIYATHGCIFIMSNKILSDFPDDKYFLYAEEVTIAELSRKHGYSTKYIDDISVTHVSHATTGDFFSKSQFINKRNAIKHILGKYSW